MKTKLLIAAVACLALAACEQEPSSQKEADKGTQTPPSSHSIPGSGTSSLQTPTQNNMGNPAGDYVAPDNPNSELSVEQPAAPADNVNSSKNDEASSTGNSDEPTATNSGSSAQDVNTNKDDQEPGQIPATDPNRDKTLKDIESIHDQVKHLQTPPPNTNPPTSFPGVGEGK